MPKPASEYYVQVSSKAKSVFFSNKCNNFKVKLQEPLDIHIGKWTVALTKILFPHNWFNLKGVKQSLAICFPVHKDFEFSFKQDYDNAPFLLKAAIEQVLCKEYGNQKTDWKFIIIDLLDGYYSNAGEIAAHIDAQFSYNTMSNEYYPFKPIYSYEASNGHIFFKSMVSFVFIGALEWADALRLRPVTTNCHNGVSVCVYFPTKERNLEGTCHTKKIDAIYLYSSVVEHNYVGDTLAPLLTVVPVSGAHGDTIAYSPLIPEYKPVAKSYINDIEIQLNKNTGELIDFSEGGEVTVTLHFKKIEG